MITSMWFTVLFVCLGVGSNEVKPGEPQCFSRFDYEYKVLQRIIQLEENQKRLDDKIKKCEQDEVIETNVAKGVFVAFSAYVDTTTTMADKTVFNKVLVNKGTLETAPYDMTSGVFTCPVSGFYLVSIVVAVRGANEAWAIVRHNGVMFMNAVIEGYGSSSQDLQGGNTAVIKLSKGDTIWVSGSGTLPGNSGGNTDTRTSSFSAVLLHPSE